MTNVVELPVMGSAFVKLLANVRQGAPSPTAPVLRKLPAGEAVQVAAFTAGDTLQGNANWYRLEDGGYLWSGACGPLMRPEAPKVPDGLNHTPLVVDLSHLDGVTSFEAGKNAGLAAVIHKATTGATGRDDQFHERRDAATKLGLLWGAYHWGTAAPIEDQVANFLNMARPDAHTLVALDFEASPGNQMSIEGARQFCELIYAKLGQRPAVYSGELIKSALGVKADPFFGSHRLWLSQYGARPVVQPSWKSFWLWQYTDGEAGPGVKKVPGVSGDRKGRLDCNFFDGTPADLAAQWAPMDR